MGVWDSCNSPSQTVRAHTSGLLKLRMGNQRRNNYFSDKRTGCGQNRIIEVCGWSSLLSELTSAPWSQTLSLRTVVSFDGILRLVKDLRESCKKTAAGGFSPSVANRLTSRGHSAILGTGLQGAWTEGSHLRGASLESKSYFPFYL